MWYVNFAYCMCMAQLSIQNKHISSFSTCCCNKIYGNTSGGISIYTRLLPQTLFLLQCTALSLLLASDISQAKSYWNSCKFTTFLATLYSFSLPLSSCHHEVLIFSRTATVDHHPYPCEVTMVIMNAPFQWRFVPAYRS